MASLDSASTFDSNLIVSNSLLRAGPEELQRIRGPAGISRAMAEI
jgi:hypothetical protein